MRRRVFVTLVLIATLASPVLGSGFAFAVAPSPSPGPGGVPGVSAGSAILVSLDNGRGRVLFARRAHDMRAPASLTKVVTALVARDIYKLDDVVTTSPLVLQSHGSDLNLEPGMKITVRNLLYALLLKSANDAGMALAGYDPFGYEHFVRLMNQKARSLGARETHFNNPHGLDYPGHVSSAWDMALFTRELLADPVLADIVKTKTHRMPWKDGRQRIFDNHNKLIGRYADAVGVKTGFTAQAGHCLIAAARTADGIAFSVVMDSQDHYADSTALLDYAKTLEVRVGSGGGGVDIGRPLSIPPALPAETTELAAGAIPGLDPRDDARWLVVMLVITVLTLATIGVRRRAHPLRDAADVLAWVEPFVPPDRP
jgi:D-alanyl-D-alanine carboxypeptidase (penicillin-binding protein 5/6)